MYKNMILITLLFFYGLWVFISEPTINLIDILVYYIVTVVFTF